MVLYVFVTSFLQNVAFLMYALFGEISILEIPVVGNLSLFAGPGVGAGAGSLVRAVGALLPSSHLLRVPQIPWSLAVIGPLVWLNWTH